MQQDFRWHKTLLADTKRQCYLAPETDQLLLPQEEKILCEFLSLQKMNRLNVKQTGFIYQPSVCTRKECSETNHPNYWDSTTSTDKIKRFYIYGEGTVYYNSPQRMAIKENTAYNTYRFILPAMQNVYVQKQNHLLGGNYKRKIK